MLLAGRSPVPLLLSQLLPDYAGWLPNGLIQFCAYKTETWWNRWGVWHLNHFGAKMAGFSTLYHMIYFQSTFPIHTPQQAIQWRQHICNTQYTMWLGSWNSTQWPGKGLNHGISTYMKQYSHCNTYCRKVHCTPTVCLNYLNSNASHSTNPLPAAFAEFSSCQALLAGLSTMQYWGDVRTCLANFHSTIFSYQPVTCL